MTVTLDDVRAAAKRIAGAVVHTPCLRSETLSRIAQELRHQYLLGYVPEAQAPATAPDQPPLAAGSVTTGGPEVFREVVGPDGVKRRVRVVAPTL